MEDDHKDGQLLQMHTTKIDQVPIQWQFSPHGGYTGVVRYAILTIGMTLTSLIMYLGTGPLQSVQGVPGPTVALSTNPPFAAMVLAVLLAASLVVAVVVGRLINALVGLFVLGWGIMVLDMQCGTVSDLVFVNAAVFPMVIEGLVWSAVVLLMAATVFRGSGPLPDYPKEDARNAFRSSEVFSSPALKSALAGLVVLIVTTSLMTTDLKGQAIAACVIAGIFTGLFGRMISPKVQPILLFAAPMLFGTLGYAIGLTMQVKPLEEMFLNQSLPRLICPMPMDYVVGSLCGVAMGIGWGRASSEEGSGD